MIKIAIGGIHGTGKSTLINKTKELIESLGKSVYVVKEVARIWPLELGTIESQRWIWEAHINEEIKGYKSEYDITLCDRTLLDNLLYYKYLLGDKPDSVFSALMDCTINWMNTYDYISVLDINPEFIVDDGFRIVDMNKTIEINKLFVKYLKPYQNININRYNYEDKIMEILNGNINGYTRI